MNLVIRREGGRENYIMQVKLMWKKVQLQWCLHSVANVPGSSRRLPIYIEKTPKMRPLLISVASNLHRFFSVYSGPYHKILNVLLHQVALGGDQHRSPKSIQICVVQLIGHAVDFVRCIHMNVSKKTSQ